MSRRRNRARHLHKTRVVPRCTAKPDFFSSLHSCHLLKLRRLISPLISRAIAKFPGLPDFSANGYFWGSGAGCPKGELRLKSRSGFPICRASVPSRCRNSRSFSGRHRHFRPVFPTFLHFFHFRLGPVPFRAFCVFRGSISSSALSAFPPSLPQKAPPFRLFRQISFRQISSGLHSTIPLPPGAI